MKGFQQRNEIYVLEKNSDKSQQEIYNIICCPQVFSFCERMQHIFFFFEFFFPHFPSYTFIPQTFVRDHTPCGFKSEGSQVPEECSAPVLENGSYGKLKEYVQRPFKTDFKCSSGHCVKRLGWERVTCEWGRWCPDRAGTHPSGQLGCPTPNLG